MSQSINFQSDLRISPRIVSIGLAILGFITLLWAVVQPALETQILLDSQAVVLFLSAWVSWKLIDRQPKIGCWVTIIMTITAILFMTTWLEPQLPWVLLFIPVALAAGMINHNASGLVALGVTGLLFTLAWTSPDTNPTIVILSLVQIWGIWALMGTIYRPIQQVVVWTEGQYHAAQSVLEETRNRRSEYEQTLQDLAEANRQLRGLNALAQNLRRKEEEARAAKDQFVANVSHELRTPLNMITGYTELILQSPNMYGKKIPGALLADLEVIQRNAEHLSHLVDDVLDLSQVEAGQMALTKEYVDFREVIGFSMATVQPLYKIKGLQLGADLPTEPLVTFCDRTRMQEVLLNLLSNAGRFTEKGGVQIRAWRQQNDLFVSISDTGLGISPGDLQRLFTPFEQLDGTIRQRFGGTGLGLVISKRFVEMHNGKIWVESSKGTGTTFYFSIPLPLPDINPVSAGRWFNPHLLNEPKIHLPQVAALPLSPRFVVIDANNTLPRLLQRYMSKVQVVFVKTFEEASVELEREATHMLLFNGPIESLDVQKMPELEKDTPVIACQMPGDADQAQAIGVAGILTKPVTRPRLLEMLAGLGIHAGTILIVDNDPDALQLFTRMLTTSDLTYRVMAARDGQEALDLLQDVRPAVILLDLVMPNLSGFQFLDIRSGQSWEDIPIIIVSARDTAGHPIVSNGLWITQKDGFSASQLLNCIQAISQTLAMTGSANDPELQSRPGG